MLDKNIPKNLPPYLQNYMTKIELHILMEYSLKTCKTWPALH